MNTLAPQLLILFLTLGTNAQDLSSLFEKLDPSVVTIEVVEYKIKGQQLQSSGGIGSGVIVDKEGHIVTAAHIVEAANEVSVKLQNGTTYPADVLSSSLVADVALLKLRITPASIVPVTMGDSDISKVGEQIFVIGAPLGLEHSLSVGYISRKISDHSVSNGQATGLIQTDASINRGNSGGPIFNMKGELIGIVSYILSNSGGFEGLGFGVDINTIKKVLFNVDDVWAGFEGIFLNEQAAGIFNTPQVSGVLVQRVTPNSFADRIGILPGIVQGEILGRKLWLGGDIILNIQGIACNAPHDLGNIKKLISALNTGDQVYIDVLRKGKIIKLTGKF
ncbi:trypsin-like peptidase domain-containing protein [Zobellia sp.]|nr:trypsin-like peptidase domain-containing protein [Zobellia sp.]